MLANAPPRHRRQHGPRPARRQSNRHQIGKIARYALKIKLRSYAASYCMRSASVCPTVSLLAFVLVVKPGKIYAQEHAQRIFMISHARSRRCRAMTATEWQDYPSARSGFAIWQRFHRGQFPPLTIISVTERQRRFTVMASSLGFAMYPTPRIRKIQLPLYMRAIHECFLGRITLRLHIPRHWSRLTHRLSIPQQRSRWPCCGSRSIPKTTTAFSTAGYVQPVLPRVLRVNVVSVCSCFHRLNPFLSDVCHAPRPSRPAAPGCRSALPIRAHPAAACPHVPGVQPVRSTCRETAPGPSAGSRWRTEFSSPSNVRPGP